MARSFHLTWQPGTKGRDGRWRRKYRGKVHYFPGGKGKYDQSAYEAALQNWESLKVQIDAAAPRDHEVSYRTELETWEKVLTWSSQNGDSDMAARAQKKVDGMRKALASSVLGPLGDADKFESQFTLPFARILAVLDAIPKLSAAEIADAFKGLPRTKDSPELLEANRRRYASELDGSPMRISREIWADRLAVQDRRSDAGDTSLERQVESFLLHKASEAERKHISVGRLGALEMHLRWFKDWFGKTRSVHDIDSNVLMKCRLDLLGKCDNGSFGRHSAKHYLSTVRYFVKWLWRTEVIDSLPRVLDKGSADELSISAPTSRAKIFSKDEISRLLDKAPDRIKLFLLLMLNCGMTQKDVADLLITEVEWDAGRIVRKRSKTNDEENVPVVNYVLWPETLRLLKKFRAEGRSGRVLLNKNGSPLWQEARTSDGQIRKNDNIKNAYERIRRKLGFDKSLKSLKKTSATLIRDNERFRGLEGLFLGHAPQAMSDKHYTATPQASLDDAIQWLGKELAVAPAK